MSTSNYSIIHKRLNKFNKFNYEFKTHQIYNARPSSCSSSSKLKPIQSTLCTPHSHFLSLSLALARSRPDTFAQTRHLPVTSPDRRYTMKTVTFVPHFLKIQHMKYSTYVCFMFCMSMPYHLIYHECSSNNKCHRVPGENKISFVCFAVANHQNKS